MRFFVPKRPRVTSTHVTRHAPGATGLRADYLKASGFLLRDAQFNDFRWHRVEIEQAVVVRDHRAGAAIACKGNGFIKREVARHTIAATLRIAPIDR